MPRCTHGASLALTMPRSHSRRVARLGARCLRHRIQVERHAAVVGGRSVDERCEMFRRTEIVEERGHRVARTVASKHRGNHGRKLRLNHEVARTIDRKFTRQRAVDKFAHNSARVGKSARRTRHAKLCCGRVDR